MAKGLILLGIVLAIAGYATRTDCEGLTETECERRDQMVDGMIG
jgi:hypothetical protein